MTFTIILAAFFGVLSFFTLSTFITVFWQQSNLEHVLRSGVGQLLLWLLPEEDPNIKRKIKVRLVRIFTASSVGFILTVVGMWSDLVGIGLLTPIHWKVEKMPLTDIRIAVAGFDADNRANRHRALEVAEGIYLKVNSTFESLNPDLTATIWPPEQVGQVQGKSAEERAQSAEEISNRIDADVVIYGYLKSTESGLELQPEFYMNSKQVNDYEAIEMTGQFELGSFIFLESGNNISDRMLTSQEFAARSQVMAHVVIGLSHYKLRRYELALSQFKAALEAGRETASAGEQVLYVLLGNAALKAGVLDQARDYYEYSASVDPEYARAYIGLASVNYRLALKKFESTLVPSDTDQHLLKASLEMLSRASSATHQPPLSDIQTKIHFEQGQVLFMQAYADEHPNFDKAAAEFYFVTDEYEASGSSNYRIQELAAEAYARLALIYALTGNAPLSLDTYRQACELLVLGNPRKKQFRERMDTLSEAIGQTIPTSEACP